MNCPRCKTPIGPLAHPDSIVTCPGCGSRLMTRSAAMRSQGSAPPADAPAPVARPAFPALAPPPSAMPPATPASEPGHGAETSRPKSQPQDEAPAEGRHAKAEKATLDLVLREVRAIGEAVRLVLDEIHTLRRSPAGPEGQGAPGQPAEGEGPELSPIRARRQKTVVLVDDDPQTREAAVAELLRANVPVRAYEEGNAALAGIAEEKPDVIALEVGLGGDMGGKDLVNMIKATMEWVDIPIILWTREGVASQKEARLIHGGDEVVLKSAGPGALVAHVITAFRRR